MTACRNIQEIIPAYFEGAVSAGQERLVREHLASCPECSGILADLRKSQELVCGLEEVEPPPWLAQKIMAQVKDEAGREVGFFRMLFYPLRVKVPLQAFAAVLIAGLIFYVYKGVAPPFEAARTPAGAEQVLPQPAAGPPAAKERLPAAKERPPAGKGRDEGAASVAPAPGGDRIRGGRQEEKALLLRSAERTEAAGAAVKEKGTQKAGTQAALSGPDRAAKAPEPVDVTLRVVDVKSAAKEVEDLLRQTGARNVRRESHEGSESVSAELQREKVGALVEKLEDIGDALPIRPELPAGNIAIRIEMVPNNRTR